ncbi:MAG: hypothetical protein ABIK86_06910 [candidate division WOR-3 bacterium]
MVGAVLVQNTTWSGVKLAIATLRRLGLLRLRPLARVSPVRLARLIRPAGCPNVKSRRLLALLHWLEARGGIVKLGLIPTPRLRSELLAVNGIGYETADSILLYALHRRVFVVGAYTRRVLARYGLIQGNENYEQLRLTIEKALPRRASLYGEFHALLVRLGKTYCRYSPSCEGCPLE